MSTENTLNNASKESDVTIPAKTDHGAGLMPLMPDGFDLDFVTGCIVPFLQGATYTAESPLLPMIGFPLSKEKAVTPHLFGLFYENWEANVEEEGVTVFFQGYENRGPDNERRRIYQSAVTPDLIESKYRPKLQKFYDNFLSSANEGTPLMKHYFDNFHDVYWDLHVGATGEEIPAEVKQWSTSFSAVLGYHHPTLDIMRENYMLCREHRGALKAWLDERVQTIIDGKQADANSTFVYYWLKNGELGENFRRIDIVFECFHNFLAFAQWGNFLYNVAKSLVPKEGNASIQASFEKTMTNGPDTSDGGPFTPLDRFVMEMYRHININPGSGSTLKNMRQAIDSDKNVVVTFHGPANMSPLHWEDPTSFDPDRYKTAPLSSEDNDARAKSAGLTRCPFPKTSFAVKDGRDVKITNSAFGADYSEIEGVAHPVVDTSGYAPFGFGYRRCPGEMLNVEFIKGFLRKVWNEKISFAKLDIENPGKAPIFGRVILDDNIAFTKS